MLDKIRYAESLVLRGFEKFSHWTDRWFGVDNFLWAKISIVAVGAIAVMSVHVDDYSFALKCYVNTCIAILFLCYFTTCFFQEKKVKSNPRFRNEFEKSWFFSRIFVLGVLVKYFSVWIMRGREDDLVFLLSWLIFSFSVYFMSCTPLPPSESKVKSWLKKVIRKTAEVFSPAPALVPVPVKR
ncbi:hypothetical protein ACFL08_01280 [Patescibacteria group bacterium]